ncbi:MAG TPA: PD-(D/E)XK nuclease family protein [Sedimentisphaerales bacterium]|nr:PD-(D/E)XK nuclease family protein [Sedimentisphaerales bacterium]
MKTFEQSECKSIVASFKVLFAEKMDRPNMFIMPYDSSNERASTRFEKVESVLREEFTLTILELSPTACGLSNCSSALDNFTFKCIAIDSGKPEKIRDIIKEVLWPTHNDGKASPTLSEVLAGSQNIVVKPFALHKYGIFVPYRIQKFGPIRTHSFNHKPVFYRYRVAVNKIKQLPAKLEYYLQLLFSNCPNHLFQNSEFRASAQTSYNLRIKAEVRRCQECNMVELAENSKSFDEYKSRHENLEKFFLLNDPCTMACEVPVWLEPAELRDYLEIFSTTDTLTGHIDILRCETDGKIGIWDYKPGAREETAGTIQVFLYAVMLSVRTGVGLENILCGYFDESDVLFFRADEAQIVKS